MHEIVVHESAEDELNAAALFYELRELDLGKEFLEELSQSCSRIAYSIYFDEYRRYLMGRFPYGVVYRIQGQQVLVFAVAHVRRRPGYWRDRDV
jgi:ParE-like toxin of type II ParDE toxin-antitoxin system